VATGMTHRIWRQIQGARHAAVLLRSGASIAEAVHQAGYRDQAHLTLSLTRRIGTRPVVQEPRKGVAAVREVIGPGHPPRSPRRRLPMPLRAFGRCGRDYRVQDQGCSVKTPCPNRRLADARWRVLAQTRQPFGEGVSRQERS
jgi:AraC-like DNA-binding protein